MVRAFVFPGQGSQAVGMGRELAEAFPCAREVFQEVDEALGCNLSRLQFEGPIDVLTLTENAQPAIMAVSMAVVRVLESDGIRIQDKARYVAGHSLGEYTALTAAGALSLGDCARLLRTRGQAMQAAVPVGEGMMAAILGLSFEDVCAVVQQAEQDVPGGVCEAANDNAPGQVVISGSVAAVERAIELAKEKGAKRAMPLQVSAPFHCRMMEPAARVMEAALAEVSVNAPCVPLIANVTALPVSEPQEIRSLLVRQVTGSVRWRESVAFMAQDGVSGLVELGAGKVLSGLAKRIAPDLEAFALHTPKDIEDFARQI
ncbi:ACP S-malonyltransferase [Phaeovibrio sulfidiphilus]|uniref:Malonyl CoA-acyl carrier protein transacylase n=1 Tax=Phaeovibrio sulfidiphilus TaxID=1220600 RepID=A0A8J6YN05_9PROT|nr:ACP S-malonyltransferase [Phaeovibrio sulfidiphilus]MBE1236879.1 ACP S-malonyltransferase [Phaeovibrio sulfidiphilus]